MCKYYISRLATLRPTHLHLNDASLLGNVVNATDLNGKNAFPRCYGDQRWTRVGSIDELGRDETQIFHFWRLRLDRVRYPKMQLTLYPRCCECMVKVIDLCHLLWTRRENGLLLLKCLFFLRV